MLNRNSIQTYTGKFIDVSDPQPEDICIEDIAHALSNQCRFGGHTSSFYSVAEHCWHVSNICPQEYALAGLLHDASEAYLVDIPRPIKCMLNMEGYRDLEKRLQNVIYKTFDIVPFDYHQYDSHILFWEANWLMKNSSPVSASAEFNYGKNIANLPQIIPACWIPTTAEIMFIIKFKELAHV